MSDPRETLSPVPPESSGPPVQAGERVWRLLGLLALEALYLAALRLLFHLVDQVIPAYRAVYAALGPAQPAGVRLVRLGVAQPALAWALFGLLALVYPLLHLGRFGLPGGRRSLPRLRRSLVAASAAAYGVIVALWIGLQYPLWHLDAAALDGPAPAVASVHVFVSRCGGQEIQFPLSAGAAAALPPWRPGMRYPLSLDRVASLGLRELPSYAQGLPGWTFQGVTLARLAVGGDPGGRWLYLVSFERDGSDDRLAIPITPEGLTLPGRVRPRS
jgi:hypothetical protein